ncbi:MAG: ABC-F family ATP-binding cassette domain-containing protein [Bacteroidaceae bacterium]|nr:ABC-F family ATP-binding cassette domain-containing protein [Bacteroidaceae bacterium]MBR2415328.1 ABC-F family ATP-binding cassette domain-containing protein [Bacteroidaceae bacterium]
MAIDLQIEGLSKRFGDLELFSGISFTVEERKRIGLIARNGKGKSTLLKIVAGDEPADEGKITLRNGLRVGYLEQEPDFDGNLTVIEACLQRNSEKAQLIARYEQAMQAGDTAALQPLMEEMDRLDAWDYEHRAKQVLDKLKITRFNQPVGELSGGQKKRIALAAVLIEQPDLMILDEPTNHLDMAMVEWLEEYLSRLSGSLLMVTHDRYFLDNVCNEIIEIDDNTIYRYKGNYSYFLQRREERLQNKAAETARARNLLRKELDWMRRQPQARAHKAKYRIDAFYKLEEKAAAMRDDSKVSLEVKAQYIGNKIFVMKALSKAFPGKVITKDFYYTFARYEKLGIVGNNGTGKSTFIKMLLGKVPQDSGTIEVGETVKWGYYSQDGLAFNEQMKVIDVVKNIAEVIPVGNKMYTASQFLQHFLFAPEKQYSYVYKLSGGEKRRLYLCTVLMSNPNFLVLDEPTNDLDIETLQVLEEYLSEFKGCVIVVSHDRYFMDKVVDHIFVFNGDGDIKDFPGNYTEYRDWRDEERAAAAKEAAAQAAKTTPAKQSHRTEEKRKLTFKEKREYEALETEIFQLEEEKAAIEEAMSSGTLSTADLLEKSARIQQVLELIDEKTMRWLELSEYAG